MSDIFNDDDTYLARWLNGDLTGEELSEFENSDDFAAYAKIADRSSNLDTPSWNKNAIWQEISEKGGISSSSKNGGKNKLSIKWIRYAAAACLLAIVGYLALFTGNNLELHQTFAAQSHTVELPDGSVAYLNADSKLSFDTELFKSERVLILNGEAFFEVQKGSKFTVSTENGNVRVLGTSFNIKARGGKLNVQCYTGRVGVSFNEFKDEEVLIRGDILTSINKTLINRSSVEEDLNRPEWRDGRSKFTNVRFGEVINEIERQFDIKIKIDKAARNIENYNGGFPHDDLTLALEIVSSSINYDYRIDGKTVILSERK